jgi:hypothetical protein
LIFSACGDRSILSAPRVNPAPRNMVEVGTPHSGLDKLIELKEDHSAERPPRKQVCMTRNEGEEDRLRRLRVVKTQGRGLGASRMSSREDVAVNRLDLSGCYLQ